MEAQFLGDLEGGGGQERGGALVGGPQDGEGEPEQGLDGGKRALRDGELGADRKSILEISPGVVLFAGGGAAKLRGQ